MDEKAKVSGKASIYYFNLNMQHNFLRELQGSQYYFLLQYFYYKNQQSWMQMEIFHHEKEIERDKARIIESYTDHLHLLFWKISS